VNVTAYWSITDFYVDGVRLDLAQSGWDVEKVVSLDFMPSVIAVYAYSSVYGVLASDSAGLITDASWKCSKAPDVNWMLPAFNDSSWPTPVLNTFNGDSSVDPCVKLRYISMLT